MSRILNPWREFQGLLPAQPLLVAEVIAVHVDGTSTLEMPDGSQFRARGDTLSAGAFAFVQGGEIRGEAPGVVVVPLEV